MISWLRSVRVSRLQIAVIAAVSGIATGVIIANALGANPTEQAVLAALGRRMVVRDHAAGLTQAADPAGGNGARDADTTQSPSSSSDPTSDFSSDPSADTDSTGTDTSGGDDGDSSGNSGSGDTSSGGTKKASKPKYDIKHVFVIALSTTSYAAAFGHGSVAHYLNGTLRKKGTLLSGYRSLGPSALPDYLAMISGQAPNADTRAECTTYNDFATTARTAKDGQVGGDGCVYPNTVLTIGDQVTASGSTWGAYIDDMGSGPCVHPNSDAVDDAEPSGAGPQYDSRHNPFIYFHSLLDLGDCQADDLWLERLTGALKSASKAPRYAFIAPGTCDDASQTVCPDGTLAGLAGEDAFLKHWVPKITGSAAYKQDGALIIVFTPPDSTIDAAVSTSPTTSTTTTTSTTSTNTVTANVSNRSAASASGPLRTGALVLSNNTPAGHTIATSYGPYSLLGSVEQILGYTPLVHANTASSFADLFKKGS
jgi:hypothetical protein